MTNAKTGSHNAANFFREVSGRDGQPGKLAPMRAGYTLSH
jgi:hypothetical protein